MISFLYQIDKSVFIFFNSTVANPFFDVIMPFITESDHWRIPIALIWLSLIIFGGKKGRIVAVLVAVILTLSDQVSSFVVKPWVDRVRPCFAMEMVRLLIDQPGSPSFPSSHASNMASMALLFSIKYRKYIWIFIGLAVLVSYSRIYVGVHYPSDIMGGWILGMMCGLIGLGCERCVRFFWFKIKEQKKKISGNEI